MTTETDELKPCPFCGSRACIETSADWEGIFCSNAACCMSLNEQPRRSEWNTRADHPTTDRVDLAWSEFRKEMMALGTQPSSHWYVAFRRVLTGADI